MNPIIYRVAKALQKHKGTFIAADFLMRNRVSIEAAMYILCRKATR